jgi:hypothetical protein
MTYHDGRKTPTMPEQDSIPDVSNAIGEVADLQRALAAHDDRIARLANALGDAEDDRRLTEFRLQQAQEQAPGK